MQTTTYIRSNANWQTILTYLSGPSGVFALHSKNADGSEALYYIHTDHLGLWHTITNESGSLLQELSFDAWGVRRDPATWRAFTGTPPQPMFDRGFTGHEHLDGFNLINMNGRMYDPVVSRMLSPDNFVQSPDFSQSFNRYSYCANNPLKYTDPSGEFLTWNIANGGFSIGFNLTPIGIPLGAGINVGWGDGASTGVYGEVGYRVGGTGFGSGVTVSQSLDYNFKHSGWSTTSAEGAYASLGPLNAGINFSQTYDMSSKQWSNGWGINAGVGIGNERAGIGLYLGYGSNGWSYGLGGFYNPYAKPYYEATLEGYENVPQDDPMNCKNATLEAIEKLNGGSRTQDDFKSEGAKFLSSNRNAKLEQYFEHFGFNIQDPKGWSYKQIGRGMELGNPTVINENVRGGHTLTITKIRQWSPNGNVRVWFADPARGTYSRNWNIIGNPNFNKGAYLFWLH